MSGDPVGPVFGTGEDKDRVHFVVLQKVLEQIDFLRLGNFVNDARRCRRGSTFADLNGLRFVLELVGQFLDFPGKGGRKQKGLPFLLGRSLEIRRMLGRKPMSSIRSASSRTRNSRPEKSANSLIHQIHQPPGGGDDQIDPVSQSLLLDLPHPAVDGGHLERQVLGVGLDVIMDLDDQFTGRRNDQGPGFGAPANLRSSSAERSQHGQGEGSLAGTGLGNAGHAVAFDDHGDRVAD